MDECSLFKNENLENKAPKRKPSSKMNLIPKPPKNFNSKESFKI
jgi:hypothetical protein